MVGDGLNVEVFNLDFERGEACLQVLEFCQNECFNKMRKTCITKVCV